MIIQVIAQRMKYFKPFFHEFFDNEKPKLSIFKP